MKSLEELMAIKAKMQDEIAIRKGHCETKIIVSMGTCGIAAGARPVLAAFVEGIHDAGITDRVSVSQSGCVGLCQYEPVVEVHEKGKETVTYIQMTPEKAKEIIEKHIKDGAVVTEYTVGAAKL